MINFFQTPDISCWLQDSLGENGSANKLKFKPLTPLLDNLGVNLILKNLDFDLKAHLILKRGSHIKAWFGIMVVFPASQRMLGTFNQHLQMTSVTQKLMSEEAHIITNRHPLIKANQTCPRFFEKISHVFFSIMLPCDLVYFTIIDINMCFYDFSIQQKNDKHGNCYELYLNEYIQGTNLKLKISCTPCKSPPHLVNKHWNDITALDLGCHGGEAPIL